MLREEDATRLRHIVDAAREALEHAAGRTREDLDIDRQLLHSLVRCVEIIGEAANNLTSEFQAEHPEIPWAQIIGMRNRLVHGYFDINHAVVWKTVQDEMFPLISQLSAILGAEDERQE